MNYDGMLNKFTSRDVDVNEQRRKTLSLDCYLHIQFFGLSDNQIGKPNWISAKYKREITMDNYDITINRSSLQNSQLTPGL